MDTDHLSQVQKPWWADQLGGLCQFSLALFLVFLSIPWKAWSAAMSSGVGIEREILGLEYILRLSVLYLFLSLCFMQSGAEPFTQFSAIYFLVRGREIERRETMGPSHHSWSALLGELSPGPLFCADPFSLLTLEAMHGKRGWQGARCNEHQHVPDLACHPFPACNQHRDLPDSTNEGSCSGVRLWAWSLVGLTARHISLAVI